MAAASALLRRGSFPVSVDVVLGELRNLLDTRKPPVSQNVHTDRVAVGMSYGGGNCKRCLRVICVCVSSVSALAATAESADGPTHT